MSEPRKSPEFDKQIRGLRRQVDLERKASLRQPVGRSRQLEGNIDLSQLPIRATHRMRITAADVNEDAGITEADIGKFWFVPGYSKVGGPDLVRP